MLSVSISIFLKNSITHCFFADLGYPSPKIRIPLFLAGYINSQHKARYMEKGSQNFGLLYLRVLADFSVWQVNMNHSVKPMHATFVHVVTPYYAT